jgi:hypothetical protein
MFGYSRRSRARHSARVWSFAHQQRRVGDPLLRRSAPGFGSPPDRGDALRPGEDAICSTPRCTPARSSPTRHRRCTPDRRARAWRPPMTRPGRVRQSALAPRRKGRVTQRSSPRRKLLSQGPAHRQVGAEHAHRSLRRPHADPSRGRSRRYDSPEPAPQRGAPKRRRCRWRPSDVDRGALLERRRHRPSRRRSPRLIILPSAAVTGADRTESYGVRGTRRTRPAGSAPHRVVASTVR